MKATIIRLSAVLGLAITSLLAGCDWDHDYATLANAAVGTPVCVVGLSASIEQLSRQMIGVCHN